MINTDSPVWLITGTSRGIGRAIAEYALEQGDRVAGTARDPRDLDMLTERHQQHFRSIKQDVNLGADNAAAVEKTLEAFGRIDVLVNNAGYGLQGMTEDVSMEQARKQMETNFFGLLHMTKLVLPQMREQQSGYIVNISSVAGLSGLASLSIYNASKFAVVGMSEALAQEVKDFGIRVSIVEPGPYRTDWAGDSLERPEKMEHMSPDDPYAEQNRKMKQWMEAADGSQPGDPRQIAEIVFQGSRHDKPPLHMVFGDEAIGVWQKKLEQYEKPSFMQHYPHSQHELY